MDCVRKRREGSRDKVHERRKRMGSSDGKYKKNVFKKRSRQWVWGEVRRESKQRRGIEGRRGG